jgi:hypothetical protein
MDFGGKGITLPNMTRCSDRNQPTGGFMRGKTIILATIAGALVLWMAAGAENVRRAQIVKYPALTGSEPLPDAPYFPAHPNRMALSPGDTAGWTQYDYQTNASTGNRIVIDNAGAAHVCWMQSNQYPSLRSVYYNCYHNGGWEWPGVGTPVMANGSGYTNISATPDDRAAITFHRAPVGAESLFLAIDASSCFGVFSYYRPPNRIGNSPGIWPYLTIQPNGNIHVTSTVQASSVVIYSRSTDGGVSWSQPQIADSNAGISQVITSSPVSNKVAIVYIRDNPDNMAGTTGDIYYNQSMDGLVWDWVNGRVNVTNYGPDDDSLSAGSDVDAVYDYNDNLHILWNGHWEVNNSYYYYLSWLFHYSTGTGNITEIIESDSLWPSSGCDFGGWNWHYCKMSIGSDTSSNIFVAYTDFDTADCSACGYANGDIYAHWSSNGGATWSQRVNLTNSQTPGCLPGDCESDNWSTLAEKVTDQLHLFYVNDKDAGGIPQTECSITDNPMLYFRAPVSLVGIDEGPSIPSGFALNQNYPNPFNARTLIAFALSREAYIDLAVYDVLGRRVATVLSGKQPAGEHAVTWDAGDLSSGIYCYRLRTGGGSTTKRMMLLK